MNYPNFLFLIISFVSLFSFNCTKGKSADEYNTVIEYEKGKALQFPDFKLEFLEERTEKKEFPNGNAITFVFYDFRISNQKETKVISWSSGTGDIAPLDFDFDGKKFQLEMSNSEALKQLLKKNEIVIVKK